MHFDTKFVHPLGGGTTLEAALYSHRDLLGAPIGGPGGFMRDAAGGTLTLRTHLTDHVTSFVTYRVEHVGTESGDSALARGGVPGPSYGDVGTIASLATGIEYSTLDRKTAPTSGSSAGVSFEVADPMLGSDYQLAKLNAWANTHQSLGPFIVHVGGSYGSVTSKDGVVPLSERLYFDGSSQLRGFAPGALLPDGASREAFGRAEIELPIWKRAGLSVRAFEDAGAMIDAYGFGHAAAASGFGMLWRSPLGTLSVDLAYPLDGGKPVWLFNVGGAF
jgi:outer membrane protein assembly factor BamA